MRTILHIIDSLKTGGAEKLLVGYVNELKTYTNIIVTLTPENDFENETKNVKCYCLNYNSKKNILRCRKKLQKIIDDENVFLVHAHLLTATFLTRVSIPKKVKLIFSVHNNLSEGAFKTSKLSKWLELLLFNKKQSSLFVSKTVKKDYEKQIGLSNKSFVLHNYIEDEFFNQSFEINNSEKVKLVSVGSLKAQKNYTFLLEALSKCNLDFQLDIYGDGPLKKLLNKQIEKLDLKDKVSLKGNQNQIHKILPQYNIYVMPSLFEGYGIAPIEGMAIGLPLLLSNIEVFKETIGDSAHYFDPHSNKDFISALKVLIENKKGQKIMSEIGKKRAQKLANKKTYIQELNKIYNCL